MKTLETTLDSTNAGYGLLPVGYCKFVDNLDTWSIMGEHYLGTTEFARILDVSRVTVIKWIKSGRITVYNVNGRWRIPYSEVERVLKCVQRIKRVAIYARVSSSTQRSDLDKQVEALKLWVSKNIPQAEYIVVSDSGYRQCSQG